MQNAQAALMACWFARYPERPHDPHNPHRGEDASAAWSVGRLWGKGHGGGVFRRALRAGDETPRHAPRRWFADEFVSVDHAALPTAEMLPQLGDCRVAIGAIEVNDRPDDRKQHRGLDLPIGELGAPCRPHLL